MTGVRLMETPHGRLAPPRLVTVLEIVVDQGGVVQHLAGCAEGAQGRGIFLQGFGHQQGQQGPQPLAAGAEVVGAHLAQRRRRSAGLLHHRLEHPLDGVEMVPS